MDRRQRFCLRLSIALGVLLAIIGLGVRAQVNSVDLLPLSEAFRLEVSRPQADRVRISWTIAEGYYLYRQRLSFDATPAKFKKGFDLPPGIVKQDPFFGETEIYRHYVDFELPLQDGAAALERLSLRVVSQGCADVGICFPPETRKADLSVGETAIPQAGDPFAPVGAEPSADLFLPSSSKPSPAPATELRP